MGKLRIRLVLLVAAVYIGIALAAYESAKYDSWLQMLFGIITGYVAICIVGHYVIYLIALSRHTEVDPVFNRIMPFRSLGTILTGFQHLFRHEKNILEGLIDRIDRELFECAGMDNLKTVTFTDIDKKLSAKDSRTFYSTTSRENARKSAISFVLYVTTRHKMQSVEWWLLHRGYIDNNAFFLTLATAPLTFPARIMPFIRREYDPVSSLHCFYNSFYNEIDVITDTRCIQEVAFESLVEYLDEHGIDTSDLKSQRATIMNINVSGGKARFDSVMQGMKNTITPGGRE